jgi:hypothetical protein
MIRSLEAPAAETWRHLLYQVKLIEDRHRQFDDDETPELPADVVQGAERLIQQLEQSGSALPTVMTGTCDGTICLEWHDALTDVPFQSMDVIGTSQYELFRRYTDKPSTLEVIDF